MFHVLSGKQGLKLIFWAAYLDSIRLLQLLKEGDIDSGEKLLTTTAKQIHTSHQYIETSWTCIAKAVMLTKMLTVIIWNTPSVNYWLFCDLV